MRIPQPSFRKICLRLLVVATGTLLSACTTAPPKALDDVCKIFQEKNGWYTSAKTAADRWGVPVPLEMAILHQESRFRADAKTPRRHLLGLIPWFRVSSAYGYAQAQDTTWLRYQRSTDSHGADRDEFADAVDFVGWYVAQAHRRLGISKRDAYRQYLAYHEGITGYRRHSYAKKRWLMRVARKVQARTRHYRIQLAKCENNLDRGWHLWPF